MALRFAWPVDLRAEVECVRTTSSTPRPVSLSVRGALRVAAAGGTLRVAYAGWTTGLGPEADALFRATEPLVTVVGAGGALLRVDGVEAAVTALRAAGAPGDAEPDDLVREELEENAREHWGALVEAWAGAELTIGDDVESVTSVPVPDLGGEAVRLRQRVRAQRVGPCPGATGRACVELRASRAPDLDDLTRVARKLLARDGRRDGGALAPLSRRTEVTVVAEPESLVPHRLEIRRSAVAPRVAAGATGAPERTEVWTFTYPARRGTGRPPR